MKTKTVLLLEISAESNTRFIKQLENLKESDLLKKLDPSVNSIGFLIRHIAEVQLLFAKNVFGDSTIKVIAKTVIAKVDTGEWTNLFELKQYVAHALEILQQIVSKQTDTDWETTVTTAEFGTKTKAEAFARIVSHTAYHAGQIAIINKYGSINNTIYKYKIV